MPSSLKKTFSVFSALILAVTFMIVYRPAAVDSAAYPGILDEKSEQLAVMINNARIEAGVEPLYVVPYLCELSALRADECTERFDHKRPGDDDRNYDTILDQNILDLVPDENGVADAEIIAAGYSSVEKTFQMWKDSPQHWAAILNPHWTHMGVAYLYDADSVGKNYWEALFISNAVPMDGEYLPDVNKIVPQGAGDLNGDGSVDTFDFILSKQYILHKADGTLSNFFNPLQTQSADLLVDGEITIADILLLDRYIHGQISVIPITLY